MKSIAIILTLLLTSFSTELMAQNQSIDYVTIEIKNKVFSKKLKVEVDFGDSKEQISLGKEYSKQLNGKKSLTAILNYMNEKGFKFLETLTIESTSSYDGTGSGGTSGILLIMKKNKSHAL